MEAKRPAQIITLLPPSRNQGCLSPQSPSSSPRRRRKATVIASKSREQIIVQSYQQLLQYVQRFDQEVGKVVATYETSFLNAYREHSKKVRQELSQIRKDSSQAMRDHQVYVDRIESLQKQLILFRDESLKFSQINICLNEQIKGLHFQVKQLKEENSRMERRLTLAIKENKQMMVLLESLQNKKRRPKLYEESANISTLNQTIAITEQVAGNERPLSMSLRVKSRRIHCGLQSQRKDKIISINDSEPGLEMSKNPKYIRQTVLANGSQTKVKSQHLTEKREKKENRHQPEYPLQAVKDEVKRLRSQEMAIKNEYEKIFVDCVQEVRKEILRKGGTSGLNYFKFQGPRNFVQFKTIDYHSLLYLFLRNQRIHAAIFDLLFRQQHPAEQ